jgi:hypothetical protein
VVRSVNPLIEIADAQVPIRKAFEEAGFWAPEHENAKMDCPFAWIGHPEYPRAMRIYDETNSAYCFACKSRFTPVKLVATVRDISWSKAADALLLAIEYKAPDLASRWQAVTSEQTEQIDTDYAAAALKAYCARIAPEWERLQFDTEVSGKLTQCLQLLAHVKSRADVERWLEATKQAMAGVLGDTA